MRSRALKQIVEPAFHAQVEVRHGRLRLHHALRHDPAHAVVGNELVGRFVVEGQHLVVGHRRDEGRDGLPAGRRDGLAGGRFGRRRALAAGRLRLLDVGLDDPAVRARALQRRDVEAELAGQTAGEGARGNADASVYHGAVGASRHGHCRTAASMAAIAVGRRWTRPGAAAGPTARECLRRHRRQQAGAIGAAPACWPAPPPSHPPAAEWRWAR